MSSHEGRPESFKENLASQLSRRGETLESLGLKTDGLEQSFSEWFKRNRKLLERKRGEGFTKLLIVPADFSPLKGVELLRSLTRTLREDEKLKSFSGPETIKYPYNGDDARVTHTVWNDPAVEKNPRPRFFLTENSAELFFNNDSWNRPGGRRKLETGFSPQEYRDVLANHPQYQDESGYTREDILVDYLTRLQEERMLSDTKSLSYALGEDTVHGGVPFSGWYNDVDLSPFISNFNFGAFRLESWRPFAGPRVAVKGE